MADQLSLRGPDDEQVYVDEWFALAFRRLSIIDVAGGRQPIWNEAGTCCVVVNGEIYNHRELRRALAHHRFSTCSDSEVVLHLYEDSGPAGLEHLRGMFAIAVWDRAEAKLFLARDRFGIKPLYYAETAQGLLFASELKALLRHPACPRDLAWSDCARQSRRISTFIKGVELLPAAHYIVTTSGEQVRPRRYWALDEQEEHDSFRSASWYVARYADLFEDAVEEHLQSEGPVGVFLSGGLDSSMIVGRAACVRADLHCFTVKDPRTIECGDVAAAEAVAQLCEVPLHAGWFDPLTFWDEIDFSLEVFEYFVWALDKPFFGLEPVYKHELHRYAKTVSPNLKVILLGQGADEFAGGYSHALDVDHASWEEFVGTCRQRWLSLLQPVTRESTPELGELMLDRPPPCHTSTRPDLDLHLWQLQWYNLWHEDRTCAAQGIESRVPFLDHRLVELLASIPERLQAELLWDKAIIRQAAARWLPPELAQRRKVPFLNAGDPSIIVLQHFAALNRVFDAFVDKYLSGRTSRFDREKILQLMRLVRADPVRHGATIEGLIQCVGVSIFERLCINAGSSAEPLRALRPPSTLVSAPCIPFPR
jgi:asparagine synthase (glutamine-hydrolysing)